MNNNIEGDNFRPVTLAEFEAMPESPRDVTKGIYQKWVRVTPALAQRLLLANTKNESERNRNKKASVIKSIAAQAQAGKFAANGETLIISSDGRLLDAQNRLQAIIRSGATVDMLFVFGIDAGLQKTIDTGSSRNGKDTLDMSGHSNTNELSTAMREFTGFMKGTMNNESTERLAPALFPVVADAFPGLVNCLEDSRPCRDVIGQGFMANMIFLFQNADSDRATQFVQRFKVAVSHLAEGKKTGYGQIETLVRCLNELRNNQNRKTEKTRYRAMLVHTWNAFFSSRPIKTAELMSYGLQVPAVAGIKKDFVSACQSFRKRVNLDLMSQ